MIIGHVKAIAVFVNNKINAASVNRHAVILLRTAVKHIVHQRLRAACFITRSSIGNSEMFRNAFHGAQCRSGISYFFFNNAAVKQRHFSAFGIIWFGCGRNLCSRCRGKHLIGFLIRTARTTGNKEDNGKKQSHCSFKTTWTGRLLLHKTKLLCF